MLYRLARVEKLTGLDLKDPRAVLALQLGLLSIDQQGRSSKDATEHP
jgi:DNA-binding PucR family transcriptional regulator